MATTPADLWVAALGRHGALALRFAAGLVGDQDRAEDLLADVSAAVLARACSREMTFETPEHARNYLFRALRHRAVDWLRSADAARVDESAELDALAGGEHGPLDEILGGEAGELARARSEHVRTVLTGLPARDRQAIELRYGEGLSFPEMARRTGVPVSTLHSRIRTALAKIRRKIGREIDRP